jgi:hypothetical protein
MSILAIPCQFYFFHVNPSSYMSILAIPCHLCIDIYELVGGGEGQGSGDGQGSGEGQGRGQG